MRRLIVALSAVALLASGGRAFATICTADDVPGATLLAPYFEVGASGGNSPNTIITIGNASATAILAHVTLWSDTSAHALDFNVYLTGYDVQNINLEGLIIQNSPTRTASAGQDPGDTISPKGSKSQDINFASCTGILPLPALDQQHRDHTIAQLLGNADPLRGGQCAGFKYGDNVMRGYVTIDTVNNCTLRSPGDPGYIQSDITFQNVLFGSVTYVNKTQGKAYSEPLVHIEASLTNPATTTPGNYTFAGRYTNFNAGDHREPLSTTFAARYAQGNGVFGSQYFNQGSQLVVWRDSKVNDGSSLGGGFSCAVGHPSWYPLGQEGLVVFDDQEHPVVAQPQPFSPVISTTNIPFPLETQKVDVSSGLFPTPFAQGWMYLDLNTFVSQQTPGLTDPAAAQAWVSTVMNNANPNWRVAYRATQLDSACSANHFVP